MQSILFECMGKKAPDSVPQFTLAEKVYFSKEIEGIISEEISRSVELVLGGIPVGEKLLKKSHRPKPRELEQNLHEKILMVISEIGERWELVSHSQCAFPENTSEASTLAQYLWGLPEEELSTLRFMILIAQQNREKTLYIINDTNRPGLLGKIADMTKIRRPNSSRELKSPKTSKNSYEPHIYRFRYP